MVDLVEMISNYLIIDKKKAKLFIEKSDRFYRKVNIPKKRGGNRKIFLPSPEIKLIQHFLSEKYFENISLSKNATAYRKGFSIVDNVYPHLNNKHYLFIDIKDFFDNIDLDRLKSIISNNQDLDDNLLNDIMKVVTYDNKLVQGAVTSPILSNIYMHEIDNFIEKKIVEIDPNAKYTRYSDDITISMEKKIPLMLLNNIRKELLKYDLDINENKTYFSSYKEAIEITGLKINTGKISLNTNKKKKIKNMIYHKLKYKNNARETTEQVLGYLYYVMHVDPHFFNSLNLKYRKNGEGIIKRLRKLI